MYILQAGLEHHIFSDAFTWFVIFLVIFLLIGSFFYMQMLHKQFNEENHKLTEKLSERSYNVMMQKWDLERRNLSISQQNREIMESLHYAQNIQNAILPKSEKLKSWFNDSFVYYRPKHVVSGDFYFFEKHNGQYYVAAADCTGHGVAGAFMSMLGSSLLKQIIVENNVVDPSEILIQLNRRILEALRQSETSSHGGMDIILLSIDESKKKLTYTGANRPVLIIRNYEEIYYRGDKTPIGGFFPEENRRFTSNTIDIQQNDRIYLYTDGYADQFGGPEGKKLMSKKFKEILMNIHESSMDSQSQTLDNYLQNWRGKFEQVDDLLVIGIRI
jgi:phosphoserine phosphatase RsbU/P